jgi:hypothetical protein
VAADARPPRWAEYLPLDQLEPFDQGNPKNHAEELIGGSVSHFGFNDAPILDERTGKMVAGHGRRDDLIRRRTLGEEPPEGIVVRDDGQWMVLVQRGWRSRSDDDARTYRITHNEATIAGGWDQALLLTDLDRIAANPDLLDLTGFDADAVSDLRKLLEPPDLDDLAGQLGEPGDEDGWPVIRVKVPPHVHAAWRTIVEEHDGAELAAMADLLQVDPHWAPPVDWTP